VTILPSINSNINCNFTDIFFKNFDSVENWRRLLSAKHCWTAVATMGHLHLFWNNELQGEVFILFLVLWTSHHHISISGNIWIWPILIIKQAEGKHNLCYMYEWKSSEGNTVVSTKKCNMSQKYCLKAECGHF
jgi:hypothetical protein